MQEHQVDFEELGAAVVAAGFSPAPALAALADDLGWPWPFLADPDRVLYERLGFGRASLRQVFAPAAVRRYREAAAEGREVHKPVEDPRQLGGDAVVVGGRVAWLHRQATPDDRPSTATVLEAATAAIRP